MYPIQTQTAVPMQRNRGTVALRMFMLIPHAIVLYVWGIAVMIATVAQWFIGVFTAQRNQAIFEFCVKWHAYAARVAAYWALLHDTFPAFGPDDPNSPTRFSAAYDPGQNRLTVLLRYFTQIPAALISGLWGIGAFFVMVGAWFSILFTGKASEGMMTFIARYVRYAVAVNGYSLLITDEYPWPAAVEGR